MSFLIFINISTCCLA